MEEKTFKPPGSPEFSAPTAHTMPPEKAAETVVEEYEHPMPGLKQAEQEEKRKKQGLVKKLRDRLSIGGKKQKPPEEKTIEMANIDTGEVHRAKLMQDDNSANHVSG